MTSNRPVNEPERHVPNHDPEMAFVQNRLKRNRALIFWTTVIGTFAAMVFTFVVQPEYEARTSIIMPAGSEGGASGLASQLGLPVPGGGGANLALIGAILDSERMLNVLVDKTDLEKKKLREIRSVTQNSQANMIEIKFRDKNPDQALAMCQAALDALEDFNSELSLPTKTQRADLLRENIEGKLSELRELELRFEKFAEDSRSIPSGIDQDSEVNLFTQKARLQQLKSEVEKLDESEAQAQAAIKSMIEEGGQLPTDIPQLEKGYGELLVLERELVTLRSTYTNDYPTVVEKRKQAEALRKQLRDEAMNYARSFNEGLVQDVRSLRVTRKILESQIRELEIQVDVAPQEATEFERIRRQVNYLENVLLELGVRYEQALIDQATDPNRWEVLDRPELADKPVNKRFGLTFGIGFAASLLLGLILALSIRPRG